MSKREILPNFENCSEADLERVMKALPDLKQYRRLFAMQMIYRGLPLPELAASLGIDRQTLRAWIKRFNAGGVDALLDRPRAGRPRRIPAGLDERLAAAVRAPADAGQTHWTARKLHGWLREELALEVGYSTLVKWLHDKGFRLKVPRSWPVAQDEEARSAWVAQLQALLADEQVELWYLDEFGVDGDPRPRRRWVQKGQKARLPYGGTHIRMSATGLICPRTGELLALEFSRSDSAGMQVFLDHANAEAHLNRRRNVLICDNASWHRCKSLRWGAFEVMYLPPYSPDLNPIERLWLLIKNEWFSDFIARTYEALLERLDMALRWAIARTSDNQITCAIQ
jgi:transposase